MFIHSVDTQLILSENGQIMWQKDLTDPRPGIPVAHLQKGDHVLTPQVALLEEAGESIGDDKDAAQDFTKNWLDRHIRTVLAPLFALKDDDIPQGAPQDIADTLYDGLGILPRDAIREPLSQLDEDARAALRPKKIRFGPVLVYMPELNKPAAIRLKALLLTLFKGNDLSARVPADRQLP